MIEEKYLTNSKVDIRYRELSQREIAAMSDVQLKQQVQYIDLQLKLWNRPTQGLEPNIAQAALKWRAALNSERRRVKREIERRQTARVEAEVIDE